MTGAGLWRSNPRVQQGRSPEGVALGAGLLAGWPAGFLVAAAAGAAVALGLAVDRFQIVPAGVALAALAGGSAFVVLSQLDHHYRVGLEWAHHFQAVAGVTWIALVLLAADTVIRQLQARRPRR